MNSLLIYNENIATQLVFDFSSTLGATYNFQIGKQELLNTNFTIDKKIDNILKGGNDGIQASTYDCIFIPYSLSVENYTEFLGLRFAYHIRLTSSFNNLQTPIVFFGDENSDELNKLSKLANILFTRGIYQTKKISIQDFQNQITYINENFEKIEDEIFTRKLLNVISVVPSGNYSTHHSIANEWAIYRWAKALNIEDSQIQKIESTIGSNLYFKYLKAKFPIKDVESARNQILLNLGRVLYIDDEIEKGWDSIFKQICRNQKYKSIGTEFKNIDFNKIVEFSISEVKSYDPDVVILDFRLHDTDFEVTNIDDVTGYKILQKIKDYNPGIQVIIFSATNKIWNLLELQKAGADGFILKESPENSVDGNFTQDSIDKIFFSLNETLKKSYLKSIFGKLTPILTFFENLIRLETKSYVKKDLKFSQEKIKEYLEFGKSSFSLLLSYPYDLKYSYLQLILIIEDIIKTFYIDDDNKNHIVELSLFEHVLVLKRNGSSIYMKLKPTKKWTKLIEEDFIINETDNDFKNLNISADRALFNYRLFCVLFYKYNMELSEIEKFASLYNKRSRLSHSGSEEKITKGDIIIACELISILTEINKF